MVITSGDIKARCSDYFIEDTGVDASPCSSAW